MAGLDSTLVAGFTAQKQSLVERLAEDTVAAYEIINNNAGSLTVSVMHPFSRGTCYIQSSDPFQPPAIDPRWLSNPVDRQVLVEALLFNRQILATPPMVELQPAQFVPPADADEDAINQVINNGIRTEFHPSGTLAMLPLEQGGVVDSHLRVWGTQNLRVVDAGIFPLVPAAHLQAVVYGVAEKVDRLSFRFSVITDFPLKAADIIKADNLPAVSMPNLANSSLATNLTTYSTVNFTATVQPSVLASSSPRSNLSISALGLSQSSVSLNSIAAPSISNEILVSDMPSSPSLPAVLLPTSSMTGSEHLSSTGHCVQQSRTPKFRRLISSRSW